MTFGSDDDFKIHGAFRGEQKTFRKNFRVQNPRGLFNFVEREFFGEVRRRGGREIFGGGVRFFRGQIFFVGRGRKIFRAALVARPKLFPKKNPRRNFPTRNFRRRTLDVDLRHGSKFGRIFFEGRAANFLRDNFFADIFNLRGVHGFFDGGNLARDVAGRAAVVVADRKGDSRKKFSRVG